MANSFLTLKGNIIIATQLINGLSNGIPQEIVHFQVDDNGVLVLEGRSGKATIDQRDLKNLHFNAKWLVDSKN